MPLERQAAKSRLVGGRSGSDDAVRCVRLSGSKYTLDIFNAAMGHELAWTLWVHEDHAVQRGRRLNVKEEAHNETAAVLTTPFWDLVLTSSFRIP